MPRSTAKTVAEYLAQPPEDRRGAIAVVRAHVLNYHAERYHRVVVRR